MQHHKLWAGVEFKLANARFHLERMTRSLGPPENTCWSAALESSGAVIDTGWQRAFYAHLDAFLSASRSVAGVINCCFGRDTNFRMKDWFDKLPKDEQERRGRFSRCFQLSCKCFANLPMSIARHISEHRTGYPNVTVAIPGMFGEMYTGSPTDWIPISETPKIDDPDLAFLAKPRPPYPMPDSFKMEDGSDLFGGCRAYVQHAQDLMTVARGIAERVHGNEDLTLPLLAE